VGLNTKVGVFGGKIRPFSLTVCGALALSMFSVLAFQAAQASASPSGYTPHAPIFITSNDNFVIGQNGVTSGSGTGLDPYIIENWVIEASSANGIYIENTTKYFIIRNCLVENGGYSYQGILLHNVVNGKIENNTCRNNGWGILLNFSSNGNLTNNTCENNSYGGIDLFSSSNENLTNNTCENNAGNGIQLGPSSNNNILTNNTCGSNSYGIYLFFSSNDILTNNTCENNNYGIHLDGDSNNDILTYNTCENNSYGIYLADSHRCTIFCNYLLNNAENNAHDNGANYWDYNGKGNYWSDWQPPQHPDANGDGVVDQPRPISGGTNRDHYPFVLGFVLLTDFTIDVSPTSGSVAQGGSITATVSISSIAGFAETVSLSATGLPSGATASFSPFSGVPSFSSTLTISTASTISTGTYSITVTGTGGGKTHSCTYTLTVAVPDFSISVSPTFGSAVQGVSVTAIVSPASVGGFSETVSLSASGLPSGATTTFSPPSGTPGFDSTLTISTASTTPAGTYSITITGTGGEKTHSATFSLTVTTAPPTPFPWELLVGIIVVILIVIAAIFLYRRKPRG